MPNAVAYKSFLLRYGGAVLAVLTATFVRGSMPFKGWAYESWNTVPG